MNCIVAGNGEVSMGIETYQNNHEGADTLLIHCISIVELSTQVVSVYAADTDIFALLLQHLDKMKCHRLYMQINTYGYIDMTSVAELLGNKVCSALMTLHCLTASDTSGKFVEKQNNFGLNYIWKI